MVQELADDFVGEVVPEGAVESVLHQADGQVRDVNPNPPSPQFLRDSHCGTASAERL